MNPTGAPAGIPRQRLPSPPPSVAGQKRRIQGKKAHEFVGGKSSRLDDQEYAPHLRLADSAGYQVEIRRSRKEVSGPREARKTRPLPVIPPRTKRGDASGTTPPQRAPTPPHAKLARTPSFTVDEQPARPHNVTPAQATTLSREPSFHVQPQPANGATFEEEQVEAQLLEEPQLEQRQTEQQRLEAERAAQERYMQQRHDQEREAQERFKQQRLQQRLQQQQRASSGEQRAESGQHVSHGLVEQQVLDSRLEEERLQQPRHEEALRQWQEQQRRQQQRLEEERLWQEQQRLQQQHQEDQLRHWHEQQRLYQQRQEQERQWLEQQRLEQQRLERERLERERFEQQRLEWERVERERVERERLEQQRLEREVQMQASRQLHQHRIQEVEASPAAMSIDHPLPVTDSSSSVHPVSSEIEPTLPSQGVAPLPFQGAADDDLPRPHPKSAAVAQPSAYRVPSPTFPPNAPQNNTVDSPHPATAQFVAMLLQQSERTNQLMEAWLRENRELRAVLTTEIRELRAEIASIREAGLQAADEEEPDMQFDDADDAAVEGDDELGKQAATRQTRRQKKKLSVFKDPALKPALTYLQSCVRKHLFFLFDVVNMKELVKKNPPISQEEMRSYLNDEEDLLTCSLQHYRIDFQRPWKDTDFNKLAKDIFVKSFLAAHKSGEYDEVIIPPSLLTSKVVGIVLDKHMDYRRRLYRSYLSPPTKEDQEKLAKRKAMNTRRQTLRESRVCVIVEFGLNEHKILFVKLRPIHMSGDETDGPVKTHPPTFRIVEARWQSLELKTFLRALDALYRETWAKPVGQRATSGNPPRHRVEKAGRSEEGVAPVGLWRNCYDDTWLRSLRPHVRASLNIIDSDYKFTLPPAFPPRMPN